MQLFGKIKNIVNLLKVGKISYNDDTTDDVIILIFNITNYIAFSTHMHICEEL